MSDIPDEMLMAYADNELSPSDRAELDERLAHDAGLRARLEPFLATGLSLQSFFAEPLSEPVPARLIQAVAEASPSQGARASGTQAGAGWLESIGRILFPGRPHYATAFGVAALLFAGCFAGWVAGRDQTTTSPMDLVAFDNGELIAAGPLKVSLESAPSQPATGGAPVRPTMSFMSREGVFCREYRVGSNERSFSGVACRKPDGAWRIAAHVETATTAGGNGGYETASGPGSEPLNAVIDRLIQGDVLSAKDEASVIAQNWQRGAR